MSIKYQNKDLKELPFWLNANKIALNVVKTEFLFFKTKNKPCDTELRLTLCRKIINKANHVRYLEIKIDENINWKTHAHDLAAKLNRTNSVLSKLRYFVISAWGFTSYPKLEVSILQKKTLRIINFVLFNAHTSLLFKICNILKFVDTVNVECCKFLNNCFNNDSFSIFTKRFKLTSTTHSYIRSVRNSLLFIPSYNSENSDSEKNQLSTQPL